MTASGAVVVVSAPSSCMCRRLDSVFYQKRGGNTISAAYGGLVPTCFSVCLCRWTYQQTTKQQTVPKTVALFAGSIAGVTAATVSFPLEVRARER